MFNTCEWKNGWMIWWWNICMYVLLTARIFKVYDCDENNYTLSCIHTPYHELSWLWLMDWEVVDWLLVSWIVRLLVALNYTSKVYWKDTMISAWIVFTSILQSTRDYNNELRMIIQSKRSMKRNILAFSFLSKRCCDVLADLNIKYIILIS